MKFESMRLF